MRAAPAVWDDPAVDWSAARLTLLRTTWDYHLRRDAFLAWTRRAAAAAPLEHPPPVVRWNTHKGYVLDLAAMGLPVVPTILLPRAVPADLSALLDARGWEQAVLKPAVGASAHGLARVGADGQPALDALLPGDDVLMQPFLPGVSDPGELSVVVLDGDVTHAVLKRPRPGDFRVQDELGGTAVRVEPNGAEARLALDTVDAVARLLRTDLRYARIDLLPGADGAPLVLEAEMTEPGLWFAEAPEAAGRLADALAGCVDAAGRGASAPEVLPLPATEAVRHAQQLARVYLAAFGPPPWNEHEEDAQVFLDLLPRRVGRPRFRAAAAWSHGRIVGFAYGYAADPQDLDGLEELVALRLGAEELGRRWALADLAVDPAAAGAGLGGRLHDAVVDGPAWLLTRADAVPATALYERRGWRRAGTVPVGEGPPLELRLRP